MESKGKGATIEMRPEKFVLNPGMKEGATALAARGIRKQRSSRWLLCSLKAFGSLGRILEASRWVPWSPDGLDLWMEQATGAGDEKAYAALGVTNL